VDFGGLGVVWTAAAASLADRRHHSQGRSVVGQQKQMKTKIPSINAAYLLCSIEKREAEANLCKCLFDTVLDRKGKRPWLLWLVVTRAG
jgi:hypothetical protein